MIFNPDIAKRKSIRLKNYDYSQPGLYFITISIKDKLCLFWKIQQDILTLFDSGKMIEKYWLNLEKQYNCIVLHEYVVMPNHFHGIIEIVQWWVDEKLSSDRVNTRFTPTWWKFIYNKTSISSIIQWFKSKTTLEYIKNVKNNNWTCFNKKLWQKNYYEHIIRDEKQLYKITKYINENPVKWDEDIFYYTQM